MLPGGMSRHQLDALYIPLEIVAGMLKISTDTKVLRGLCLIEPILPFNIITLFFIRLES